MSLRLLPSPLRVLLLTAALAVPFAAAQPAPAPGAAFDALYARIDDGELDSPDQAAEDRLLAQLHALLPPGDAHRALDYRTLACYRGNDRPAQSSAYASRGLADARALGDARAEVRFLYCQAAYASQIKGGRPSLDGYDAGIALARKLGDARLVADGLSMRSDMRSLVGEQAAALVDILDAQRVYDARGLTHLSELNLQSIAAIYRRMGEPGRAIQYLKRSRVIAQRDGDWVSLTSIETQLAYCYEDQNRLADAEAAYQRALAMAQQHETRGDMGYAHMGLAYVRLLQGRPAQALTLLDSAQADFVAAGDPSTPHMLALRRGQGLAALGRHHDALVAYGHAARALQPSGNDRYLDMLYPARAATLDALGRPEAALADYKAYMAVHEKLRRQLGDQRAQLMRYRFDARARELENRRLRAEKIAGDQQMHALDETRRWQQRTLVLGTLLVVLLFALVLQQILRTRRLRALAHTDDLTGVANRRRLETFGDRAIARAHGLQQPLTALTFDIDHFKQINDAHGHPVGDQVLARVARACQGALRHGDLLGRTGGEEFVIVLPNACSDDGAQIAERVRSAVETLALRDLADGLQVSISIGMARLRREDTELSHLTRRADVALYRAKRQGRNRVEMEDESAPCEPAT